MPELQVVTEMRPPDCSTMPYTVASPMPVPPSPPLVVKKGSKHRSIVAASIPTPVSTTLRTIQSPSASAGSL